MALPTRTDRRRERSRRALLDAGRRVIAEKGVAALTVGDVTEAADVGRGSFYNHFEDKADLVAEVAREIITEVAERAVVPPAEREDPAVHASTADQRFLAIAHEDPAAARLIVKLASDSAVFEDAVRPYARAILEAGIGAGRFSIADLDMALLVLQSSALAVLRAMVDGEASPAAAESHAASMLVLFGLSHDEAREIARR